MKLNKNMNILIVGLGLLGGSYAQSLSRQGYKVSAITRSQTSIDYALNNNIISYGTVSVDEELISKADLVIFALYPHIFIDWVSKYQQYFKSGAVITDVTGVKGGIVDKIQSMLRADVEFIAAHPMAGREFSGVENCDERIFEKANYIIVPTEKNTADAIDLCRDLGEKLGFNQIAELTVDAHDETIAFVSQLTHCIAVALMCCNNKKHMEKYTGDSFRDLTRIARINDEMWSGLFLDNKTALINEMKRFMDSFEELYKKIKNGDREGIREMMRCSTERRKKFDETK